MTLISLLPNLAESISPAIREEEGKEEGREKEGGKETGEGRGKGGRGWREGLSGVVHAYHWLSTPSTMCLCA